MSPKQKWPRDVGTFVKLPYQLQLYPQNSDFHNVPAGGWDNHRTSNMDLIARADNHTKKGKRAKRHSNLWANMTCNFLSCERHKWQRHCDFFFQDIDKLITSELSYLLPVSPAAQFHPLQTWRALLLFIYQRGHVWLPKLDRKIAKEAWQCDGPFAPQD